MSRPTRLARSALPNVANILLYVANAVRDLPGVVLTAFELCQRGATCFVVPYTLGGRREAWALTPDFVALPVFRPYQAEQAREFLAAGIQFGLLDVEGAVWSSLDEYRQTLWSDASLRQAARCICAWGPMTADYALREGIFDKEQLRITGCPRFDFYSQELSSVYGQPLPGTRDGAPIVLLNSNYTICNQRGKDAAHEMKKLIQTYGYREADVRRWFENEVESIPKLVTLANRLATDFPELDVVIRPHPEEDEVTYQELLHNKANLQVSQALSITPWILRSIAVIQRSCTTALEASLAGKLAISPQWIERVNVYPLPESVSLPCASYDELRDVLEARLLGREVLPAELTQAIERTVFQGFFNIDGRAHKRVADAIMESLVPSRAPDRRKCVRYLYGVPRNGTRPRLSRISNVVRWALGTHPSFSWRRFRAPALPPSDEPFNLSAVSQLLRDIHAAKQSESPRVVHAASAEEVGTYAVRKFKGHALVLQAA